LGCRLRAQAASDSSLAVLRCARFLHFQLCLFQVQFFHPSLVFHFLRAKLVMRLQLFLAHLPHGSDGDDHHNHREDSQGNYKWT
jgi:hypothetical protein